MYKGGQPRGEADDIAVWFLGTDYDYENFRVRHACFPGANDYKALKTTLKAEIDRHGPASTAPAPAPSAAGKRARGGE